LQRDPNAQHTPSERAILDAAPELGPAESAVLMCWHDLASCRPVGMSGAGAIPWTAIMEWARMHGMEREQSIVLAEAIRILDVKRAERITSERNLK
jgi:hypothetical protein